jgi:hypothetical protein
MGVAQMTIATATSATRLMRNGFLRFPVRHVDHDVADQKRDFRRNFRAVADVADEPTENGGLA